MTRIRTDTQAQEAGYIDVIARSEYLRLAVGCFLVSFMNAHSTLLSVVFAQNGHSLHDIGLLLSLNAGIIIFFALMSGEIAARIGVLATLRVAIVLLIVGFGSFQFTRDSFVGALGSRIVQGMGQGIFLSAAITYVQSRLSTKRFLFLLGVFSATMPLAQAVAPPFGEWIITHYGDHFLFLLVSAPALVGLALTFGLRGLERPPEHKGLDLLASWRKDYVRPLASVIVNGTMFGFCTAYLAVALRDRNIPLAAFFTASTVTMFTSRFLALRQIERVERPLLVAAGLTLMGIGFVAVALPAMPWIQALWVASARSIWPVIFGGFSFGVGYSLTYPVLSAWMSDGVERSRRAGPQAWLNGGFNFGLFAMPLPEAWLIAGHGFDIAMLWLAGLSGLMALVLLVRRKPL